MNQEEKKTKTNKPQNHLIPLWKWTILGTVVPVVSLHLSLWRTSAGFDSPEPLYFEDVYFQKGQSKLEIINVKSVWKLWRALQQLKNTCMTYDVNDTNHLFFLCNLNVSLLLSGRSLILNTLQTSTYYKD